MGGDDSLLAMFAETAEKYGCWLAENVKEEDLVRRADADGFNWEMARQGGLAGFVSGLLPEELGGAGLDGLSRAVALERMARGRAGAASLFAVHWAGVIALLEVGDRAEVSEWLSAMAGEAESDRPLLCGVAVPAPVIGNDVAWPEAKDPDGRLSISGEFIAPVDPGICDRIVVAAPGPDGDAVIAWCRGDELASAVKAANPGSGLLEVPLAGLCLEGFEPDAAALASGGAGSRAAAALQRALYLGLASAMAGNAAAASSYAWEYARERTQTGRPIIEHMEVRRMLERMETLVEAARATALAAAADEGGENDLAVARRAYMFAGESCEEVCLDAVQCLGGYGYMEDYGLERRLRDHKSMQCILGSHPLDWVGGGWP